MQFIAAKTAFSVRQVPLAGAFVALGAYPERLQAKTAPYAAARVCMRRVCQNTARRQVERHMRPGIVLRKIRFIDIYICIYIRLLSVKNPRGFRSGGNGAVSSFSYIFFTVRSYAGVILLGEIGGYGIHGLTVIDQLRPAVRVNPHTLDIFPVRQGINHL